MTIEEVLKRKTPNIWIVIEYKDIVNALPDALICKNRGFSRVLITESEGWICVIVDKTSNKTLVN